MPRLASILATIALVASSAAAQQEPVDASTFDWSGTVTPGGTVRLDVGDGDIRVTASVEASTADGDVEVRLAAADTAQRIKAHTGSGTVTVYLPASFAGDLDARTSDGKIDSEVSLPIEGRVDPRHVHAILGTNGATRLAIDSSDGDIHLKRL